MSNLHNQVLHLTNERNVHASKGGDKGMTKPKKRVKLPSFEESCIESVEQSWSKVEAFGVEEVGRFTIFML